MRKFNQNRKDNTTNSEKETTSLGKKLKSFFFGSKNKKVENEIDYYHQYIFPNRAKDRARDKKSSK